MGKVRVMQGTCSIQCVRYLSEEENQGCCCQRYCAGSLGGRVIEATKNKRHENVSYRTYVHPYIHRNGGADVRDTDLIDGKERMTNVE